MTIITGPVIPERTSVAAAPLSPAEPLVPPPEMLLSEHEQKSGQVEIPCFTAPAPVSRKKLSFFGTSAVELIIALTVGEMVWFGVNSDTGGFGEMARAVLNFLLNG